MAIEHRSAVTLSVMLQGYDVPPQQFRLGSRDSEERFRKRCRGFFEGSAILERALELAFKREFETSDNATAIIYFIGSRCEEDFREIGLLAANGHGWGATSHLRGMYERAVAAAYLTTHPAEVDAFWEFDFVRRWRAAQKIKETFNINAEDEARLAELKTKYDAVVDQFRVSACPKCHTTRINGAWHKLHFVALAGTVGQLGRLIVPAYYMPLAQAHGTFASTAYRFAENRDGSFFIDQAASEDEAARSFRFAHLIMLTVLMIQNERFEVPELAEALENAWEHYKVGWGFAESAG